MTADSPDCGYADGQRWFRYRVGAIILDGEQVLMARNSAEPYFYSIGGGVQHGESAVDAVRREVAEETGLELEVDRLAFIHENFFDGSTTNTLSGLDCHEVSVYFLMKYSGQPVRHTGSETANGIAEWVEWVRLSDFGRVRAYPTFFATELPPTTATPKLITTRD
jgi:ADP-ribose pyrophosphatase YjhB (NUDIX family)